jgi:tripartite ATP-independent transporter DctM subunit
MIRTSFVIPEWWVLSVMPLAMALMMIEFLLRFRRGITAERHRVESVSAMDWPTILLLMLGALTGLLLIGLPVAFAFIAVNIVGAYFVLGGEAGLVQMTRNAAVSITNFNLAPIPLFILMGEILFHTKVANRAIDAIERVVTRLPGRMSLVTIFGGTVFSALSGSTIANTAMLGSTLLPEMLRRGYHPTMAMGPIMASGAIAMLIPPSALAVLLGSLAGISIAGLLVAGVIPALILASLFCLYIVVRCLANPALAPPYPLPDLTAWERWRPFVIYVLPLSGIFAVVIGSLLSGVATPTESAALGCVAAVVAAAAYRSLTWQGLVDAFAGTVKISVMILFIIAASQTFSQILSFSGATGGLIRLIGSSSLRPWRSCSA